MKALIWLIVVAVVAVGGYYLYTNYMATGSSDEAVEGEMMDDGTSADASADVSL